MTDAEPQRIVSYASSAFAQAYNEVHDPEGTAAAAASAEAPDAAAEGAEAPATPGEGAGADAGAADAPDAGAESGAPRDGGADAEAAAAGGSDDDAEGGDEGGSDDGAAAGAAAAPSLAYDDVIGQIGGLSEGLRTTVDTAFRASATKAVYDDVHPQFIEAINKPARFLIGESVPNLKTGEGMETLRDSADAENWQKTAKQLIDDDIDKRTKQAAETARPMMEVLQKSVLIFQDNKDLVPNTKEFDKELADRVASLAAGFEFRVDGKLLGYQVPIQQLINQTRNDLTKERAARPTPRQVQAAEQDRTPDGRFDGPQAGISSRAETSAPEEEDYSTFWNTVSKRGSL